MTAYADFIQDFPLRCEDILETFYADAKRQNREVTLLFMTAAASLVIPFERLRTDKSHPIDDAKTYQAQADDLESALRKPFLKSDFWQSPGNGSWRVGVTDCISTPPDSWMNYSGRCGLGKDDQAVMVVARLRNALAHGNVFVKPQKQDTAIAEIVFASEIKNKEGEKNGFNFICVTPDDFRIFISKWLKFLGAHKGQESVVDKLLVA